MLNEELNIKSRAVAFQWHFSLFTGIKTLLSPQQNLQTDSDQVIHQTLMSLFLTQMSFSRHVEQEATDKVCVVEKCRKYIYILQLNVMEFKFLFKL